MDIPAGYSISVPVYNPSSLRARESIAPDGFHIPYPWLGPFIDGFPGSGAGSAWWSPLATRSRHVPGQPDGWMWNEFHLERVREASRLLIQEDDHAAGIIYTMVDYTGGKGLPWKGCRKRGYEQTGDTGDEQPEDVKQLQQVFDDYGDATAIRSRQAEHVFRKLQDGASIRRLFRGKSGKLPERRWVEPEAIAAPPGHDSSNVQVSFGVLCDEDDPQKVLGYWVCDPKNHADGECVRAAGADEGAFKGLCEELGLSTGAGVILYSKYGTVSTVKVGLPLFFSSETMIRAARVLLSNILETSKEQARIAWLAQHQGATLSAVQDFSAQLARASGMNVPAFQSGQLVPTPAIMHGPGIREIRTNENTTYAPGPVSPGTPNFILALDKAIRSACSRARVPFHMVAMDTSDANYAGILEAGSPFVMARENELAIYADDERAEAREVIRLSVESGLVTDGTPDDLDAEITPPTVAIKNDLEAEQVQELRQNAGVISRQMRIRANGHDPKHVFADIEADPIRAAEQEQAAAELEAKSKPPVDEMVHSE